MVTQYCGSGSAKHMHGYKVKVLVCAAVAWWCQCMRVGCVTIIYTDQAALSCAGEVGCSACVACGLTAHRWPRTPRGTARAKVHATIWR